MTGDRQESCLALLVAAVEGGADGFLDFEGDIVTFPNLLARADAYAAGLIELGVRPGDRVVGLLDNSPDAVLAWFAAGRAGAVFVPINTANRGEFLHHQLRDSEPAVVIAEAGYLARLGHRSAGTAAPRVVVRGKLPDPLPDLPAGTSVSLLSDWAGASTGRGLHMPKPDEPGHIIYTSGTTGRAKGCVISHNHVCNFAREGVANTRRTADEMLWTPLPLFHMGAVTYVGQTLILRGRTSISSRFSPSRFWPEVERTGARIAALLGTMIAIMAEAPETPESRRCFGQLRLVTGHPCRPETARLWRERFGVTTAGVGSYGMTEAAPMTGTGLDGRPGSAGRVNDSFEVRIVDEDDLPVPTGVTGQIVCRPKKPNVMFQGYWRNPEATVASQRNLWFHTGDLGWFDEDGWLFFAERAVDRLRRGGENISSFEVESALLAHPDVAEVVVTSVPAEKTEDEVKVTAVLRPGATLTPEQLCRWSFDELPRFAVPRYIEFRAELPKNPVGRVMKFVLRDEGCTEATWDRVGAGVEVPRV